MFDITHFAYLDAGTGSLLIQSVIGVVAGVGVFGRRAISGMGRKAKDLFSRNKEN